LVAAILVLTVIVGLAWLMFEGVAALFGPL
jgi:hypothetical protein